MWFTITMQIYGKCLNIPNNFAKTFVKKLKTSFCNELSVF